MNSVLFDSIFTEEIFALTPAPTVVIDEPWESLGSGEKILLEKILTAVKQSYFSVSIVHQPSLDLAAWSQKPSRVIYFGKPVKGVPQYEPVEAAGVTVVAADRLTSLTQSDESRKRLWVALKKQFAV